MSDLFVSRPGTVAVLTGVAGTPGSLQVRTGGGRRLLTENNVIISGFSHSRSSQNQFQQTLDEVIYLYSFGEKIGTVAVSGLALADTCGLDGRSGAERVSAVYDTARLTRSNSWQPLIVWMGMRKIQGWAVDFSLQQPDPQSMITQWTLHLAATPPKE